MGNTEAKNRLFQAITNNDPEAARSIIRKYPSIKNSPISSDLKTTALTRAAYLNRPHILSCLIELGADPDRAGESGISPLMWASARGHSDCIEILLNFGATIDQRGPYEMTAIDYAVLYGRYEQVWQLLSKGAICTKTVDEFSAIREASETLWVDFQGILMSIDCKIPADVAPPFTVPPKVEVAKLEDPVADPDESWKDWFNRVIDFEEPPRVERESLPASKQPQNKISGKVKILFGIDNPPLREMSNHV